MAILPGTRIRDNGIFGTITDNPLTAGAVTFNSANLALLSAVSGNHALVTLDPLRQHGAPEIVMVTAHTAASTVATITRGMFGTVARSHPQGSLWVHAAADNDFIEVVTSGTRPSDQYEGQFIFETDTNKLVGFGGVDWAPRDAGGLLGYAPVVTNQGSITGVEVDLTGATVSVSVGTGRQICIIGQTITSSTIAASTAVMRIKEGATTLSEGQASGSIAGNGYNVRAMRILSPSAGLHTYKLTILMSGGTGTSHASANSPAFISVEDIGAA